MNFYFENLNTTESFIFTFLNFKFLLDWIEFAVGENIEKMFRKPREENTQKSRILFFNATPCHAAGL